MTLTKHNRMSMPWVINAVAASRGGLGITGILQR
jgi:hypothetical protein